jgi:transposase-like protein
LTITRQVITYSPQLEATLHRRKRPVGLIWGLDETYMQVRGAWQYLYHAVDETAR